MQQDRDETARDSALKSIAEEVKKLPPDAPILDPQDAASLQMQITGSQAFNELQDAASAARDPAE